MSSYPERFGFAVIDKYSLKYKTKKYLSLNLPNIKRTIRPIFVTLGGCIVGDPRTCSVEFGAIWTQDMFKINKVVYRSGCEALGLDYTQTRREISEISELREKVISLGLL